MFLPGAGLQQEAGIDLRTGLDFTLPSALEGRLPDFLNEHADSGTSI